MDIHIRARRVVLLALVPWSRVEGRHVVLGALLPIWLVDPDSVFIALGSANDLSADGGGLALAGSIV